MAYTFNGTSDSIVRSLVPITAYPATLAVWINLNAAVVAASKACCGIHRDTTTHEGLYLQVHPSAQRPQAAVAAATTFSYAEATVGLSVGVWAHVCGVFTNSTSRDCYVNAGNKGSDATNKTPNFALMNRTVIGSYFGSGGPSSWINAQLAHYAIWDAALGVDEIAALAKGYSPSLIRTGNLVLHVPLLRSVYDLINNTAFTLNGTPASPVAHPRIIMTRSSYKTQHGAVTVFYMRPDADDADGTWTTETGGTTLFASIDEPAVDDADYIQSAQTPQNDICRVRISDPTATPAEPFNVRYRYKKLGADTVDLIVRLKEGTTTRVTWTHSNVGTDFTTVTQTLSAGEFATITDFTNLFVEFEADTP